MCSSVECSTVAVVDNESAETSMCKWTDLSNNRFVAAFLIAVSSFLFTFLYDMPGSLQLIIQNTFLIESYQFEYLYSIYALPNVIVCFANGIILDRYLDLKMGAFIFVVIGLSGQILQTVGGFYKKYWVLLLGRIIYGVGGESLSIILISYLIIWFNGKELNILNSIYACVMRLGSSSVFLIALPLYNRFSIVHPKDSLGFTLFTFIFVLLVMGIFINILGCYTNNNNRNEKSDKTIDLSSIINLPITFWLNIIVIALSVTTIVSFISISQSYFQSRYQVSIENANFLSSFFNLVGGFAPILPGILADLLGYDLFIILLGVLSGVAAHCLFLFTDVNVYIPLVLFAFSFAIINTVSWGVLAFAVQSYQVSTALGVAFCSVHLFNSFCPIIVGYLLDKSGPSSIFILFLSLSVVSLFCILLNIILDKQTDGILNISSKVRNKLQQNNPQEANNTNL